MCGRYVRCVYYGVKYLLLCGYVCGYGYNVQVCVDMYLYGYNVQVCGYVFVWVQCAGMCAGLCEHVWVCMEEMCGLVCMCNVLCRLQSDLQRILYEITHKVVL